MRARLELIASVAELGERVGVPELQLRAGVVTGEVAVTLGRHRPGHGRRRPREHRRRGCRPPPRPGEVWVDLTTRNLTAGGVDLPRRRPARAQGQGRAAAAVPGRHHRRRRRGQPAGRRPGGAAGRPRARAAPGQGALPRHRRVRAPARWSSSTARPASGRRAWPGSSRSTSPGSRPTPTGTVAGACRTATAWPTGRWPRRCASRLGMVDEANPAEFDLDRAARAVGARRPPSGDWMRPRLATLLGARARRLRTRGPLRRVDRASSSGRRTTPPRSPSSSTTRSTPTTGCSPSSSTCSPTPARPMFVLLLSRPELLEQHPQLGGRRAARVRLEPLTDSAMAQLVDGLVRRPPRGRADSAGLTRGGRAAVRGRDRARPDRPGPRAARGRPLRRGRGRLGRSRGDRRPPPRCTPWWRPGSTLCTPGERRVVADASVLGTTFTQQGISVLCHDLVDLPDLLASLQRKEIIGTDNDRFSAERGQFRFVQSVVRQVAYATLSRRDRKLRHLAVAGHLEGLIESQPEITLMVARHLVDAVEASTPDDRDVAGLNERGALLLMKAAERSARLGAPGDALRLFEEAASRMPDGIPRAEALMGGAVAASAFGRQDDSACGSARRQPRSTAAKARWPRPPPPRSGPPAASWSPATSSGGSPRLGQRGRCSASSRARTPPRPRRRPCCPDCSTASAPSPTSRRC